MTERFSVRPDPAGFSVIDLGTGETLVIAMALQQGLSEQDAQHTARMLNQRHEQDAGPLPAAPRG